MRRKCCRERGSSPHGHGCQQDVSHGQSTVHALRNASLTINAGELIGIFGPSGSGKTTLLMIAGLLDTPSSGSVLFKGQVVSAPGIELNYLRDFRRRHIGFVFQKPNLIPFLAAAGNVQIAMQINDEEKTVAAKRAVPAEQFGIGDRADNLPIELSGGEQQRVAIARALANRPELILADSRPPTWTVRAGGRSWRCFAASRTTRACPFAWLRTTCAPRSVRPAD